MYVVTDLFKSNIIIFDAECLHLFLMTSDYSILPKNIHKGTKAIPVNCFISHRPIDPLFFKVLFKENITDPYFWKFQWK